METKFINFFKYLEDKGEQRTPLRIKLRNPEQFEITPEDLNVKGDLNLYYAKITSLPDNLKVGRDLNLGSTPITSLPDGLKVGRDLFLIDSKKITSLPNDLKVGGTLNLSRTLITSLPKDLKVGGNLDLRNTPLSSKTEAEIRQMAPNIKGEIIGLNQ